MDFHPPMKRGSWPLWHYQNTGWCREALPAGFHTRKSESAKVSFWHDASVLLLYGLVRKLGSSCRWLSARNRPSEDVEDARQRSAIASDRARLDRYLLRQRQQFEELLSVGCGSYVELRPHHSPGG